LVDRFHPSVAAIGENLDECLNFDHVFFLFNPFNRPALFNRCAPFKPPPLSSPAETVSQLVEYSK